MKPTSGQTDEKSPHTVLVEIISVNWVSICETNM
jgi:hypothetical protein